MRVKPPLNGKGDLSMPESTETVTQHIAYQFTTAAMSARIFRFVGIIMVEIIAMGHLPGFDPTLTDVGSWMPGAAQVFEWIKVVSPAVVGLYTQPPKRPAV